MELYIVLCVIVLAMVYVAYNYFKIKKMDEGTAEMAEMAGIIPVSYTHLRAHETPEHLV